MSWEIFELGSKQKVRDAIDRLHTYSEEQDETIKAILHSLNNPIPEEATIYFNASGHHDHSHSAKPPKYGQVQIEIRYRT
jgi:hypothetical protein